MTLWQYVEAHHEDFGVALFVIPVLLVGPAIVGICHCVAWLLH
jgi:hypothetical protein